MNKVKKINSKVKGNSFERTVAKKLTEEFKEYTDDKFNRTPASGMYMGGNNAAKNINLSLGAKRSLTGDIIVPDKFRYFIEAKNYSTIDIYNLLTKSNEKQQLYKWIDECLDAENSGYDGWIIIAKQNRKDILIIASQKIFNDIEVFNLKRGAFITYKNEQYKIVSYKDFFDKSNKLKFFTT